jgi:hypothetical protein
MHFNRFGGTHSLLTATSCAHEDNGMMGIIDVSKNGKLSRRPNGLLTR